MVCESALMVFLAAALLSKAGRLPSRLVTTLAAAVAARRSDGPLDLVRLAVGLSAAMIVHGCSPDDATNRRKAVGPAPTLAQLMQIADARRGERLFAQCAACHTIAKDAPDQSGPNLFNIVGAPVAGGVRFGYTYALKEKGGLWTVPRLHQWLTSPQRFAPGTQMLFAGLDDPIDRADVIAYLASQSPASRHQ